jgi:hypothetical protein
MGKTVPWWRTAKQAMKKLKKGDKIQLHYGKNSTFNMLYHVRGMVDGWLVVRRWIKNCGKYGWRYECLSPAWWSTFSVEPAFKVKRKKK